MDNKQWFTEFTSSKEYTYLKDHPIVYFCAEYALSDNLPIYAGGLGILAGDIIREATEQNIPFLCVGLYYYEGYLHQDLYKERIMMKTSTRTNPASVGLTPVVDKQNNRITIQIPIQDTQVHVAAWEMKIGSVCVYLLDTNISENTEEDRRISDQIYASSKEIRFKQEIVLGLGGLRLLETLAIKPIGYHLNEGHSALLALEIARYEMQKHKRTFAEELDNTKQHIFFTNHTLVPAGNETINTDLVATLLTGFAKELQVPVNEIINLGLIAGSSIFSMTLLALRMAGKINAVSHLQAEKAKSIWKEYKMIPITNGVHIHSWDKIKTLDFIWEKHQENKRLVLDYIQKTMGVSWDQNTLLLGWGRRIVGYKRPLALFDNLEQFKNIATKSNRPVRVVISGLSHQNDAEGLAILEHIQKLVKQDLRGIVVYLPDYRMSLAKLLVAGCDVWLNTPVVGSEACGTSGMKAALNGVLPCSTPDGWVAEANLYNVGWLLKSENVSDDIQSVLENQIIPLYYNRKDEWVKMMQNARDMAINQFSATTMLRKYIEQFYLPVIQSHETKLASS